MGDEQVKQLWELILPILGDSPLFLMATFIMTIEGVGIQVLLELMLPDSQLEKLTKIPMRTSLKFFLGLGWTTVCVAAYVLFKHKSLEVTNSQLESAVIPALFISTSIVFLVFMVLPLVVRNR